MNTVYNSSSDICRSNKEQCFAPTLLSWSSIQLSTKSFVSSMTETGKYYLRLLKSTKHTETNANAKF